MKRIQLVILFVFLYLIPQMALTQEQRILRDRFSFETAAEMYDVADTAAFTKEAAVLVERITLELKKGTKFEDAKIWNNMEQLEPYRMSKEVRDAVKDWIKMALDLSNTSQTVNAILDPSSIANSYLNGDFENVIKFSRQLLVGSMLNNKGSYPIRNNFALALMHQNKDLCALIELELVRALSEQEKNLYFPVLINLTVVNERLGERNSAINYAKKLISYTKNELITVPMINFNYAWFWGMENGIKVSNNIQDEQYSQLFKNINAFDRFEVDKYKSFTEQVRLDYQSRPTIKIGWLGKLGLFGSKFRNFCAIMLFLIAGFILLSLLRFLLGAMKYSSKSLVDFFIFCWLALICLFSIFAWGISVLGICLTVVYILIFSFIISQWYSKNKRYFN